MNDTERVLKGKLLNNLRDMKNFTKEEVEYLKKVIVHELTVLDIVSIFKYGKEFDSVSEKNSGKIVSMTLDLQSKKLLNEAGEIRKGTMSILGIVFGGYSGIPVLGWAIYRLLRSAVDLCTRKCGTFGPNLPTRQYCLYKCKLNAVEAALAKAKATKCPSESQTHCDKLVLDLKNKAVQIRQKVKGYEAYLGTRGKVGREPLA